jgi:tetratricopeptide (TPR) repeat protein
MENGDPDPSGANRAGGADAELWRVKRVLAGSGALVLLIYGLVCLMVRPRSPAPRFPTQPRQVRPVRHSPFADKLREARWYRMEALDAANEDRSKLIERDPSVEARQSDSEALRRRLMVEDRTGKIRRALVTAQEAVKLARGPTEEYQAREWLTLIACDAGKHQEELRQAQRLLELEPRNVVSLTSLRRAARCNHRWALVRAMNARLALQPGWPNETKLSSPYGQPKATDE